MSYAGGIDNMRQATNVTGSPEAKEPARVTASDSMTGQSGMQIANVGHADQASLSTAGGLVAQALNGSDTRGTKVGALQSAIAAGSYNVSSSDVADKIIQSLLNK